MYGLKYLSNQFTVRQNGRHKDLQQIRLQSLNKSDRYRYTGVTRANASAIKVMNGDKISSNSDNKLWEGCRDRLRKIYELYEAVVGITGKAFI